MQFSMQFQDKRTKEEKKEKIRVTKVTSWRGSGSRVGPECNWYDVHFLPHGGPLKRLWLPCAALQPKVRAKYRPVSGATSTAEAFVRPEVHMDAI